MIFKDKICWKSYLCITDETCWILVTDHFTILLANTSRAYPLNRFIISCKVSINAYLTGTYYSNLNGPVEQACHSVGNRVWARLTRANLPFKFWSYVFFRHLQISKLYSLVYGNAFKIFQATGKKGDFSGFQTFGSIEEEDYVLFNFIPHTTYNIKWYDCKIGHIGTTPHSALIKIQIPLFLMSSNKLSLVILSLLNWQKKHQAPQEV